MRRFHWAARSAWGTAICVTVAFNGSALAANPPSDAGVHTAPAAMPGMTAPPSDHPGPLPETIEQWAASAQLFGGLGDFHRDISTNAPQAQTYFDQGMRLLWAFNHDEATVAA